MTTAIRASALTKQHGPVLALDRADFEVRSGTVTCFLGPNGAGKSTALRLVTGFDRPTSGTVTVHDRPLAAHGDPGRVLGSVLSSHAAHPGQTARGSLRWVARLAGVPAERADELLEEVGLGSVAGRRTRGFSLGMRQRLALAIALVPDPEVVVLDEPMNGLDPEGIAWLRGLFARLRTEGRTVFFSTHLLAEVEGLVDDLVVLVGGRVVANGSAAEFTEAHQTSTVVARCDDPQALTAQVRAHGGDLLRVEDGDRLHLTGIDAATVGRLAGDAGVVVTELATARGSLHDAFGHLSARAATATRDDRRPTLQGASS
jgi:ABC-2 type transport system ATP-binding protein